MCQPKAKERPETGAGLMATSTVVKGIGTVSVA